MMNRQEEEQTGGWATNYQTEISRSPAVPYSTVMDSNNNSTPAKGQHCAGMPQLGNLKPKERRLMGWEGWPQGQGSGSADEQTEKEQKKVDAEIAAETEENGGRGTRKGGIVQTNRRS
jgi:hypothetical protein